jgi:hypothetical protein
MRGKNISSNMALRIRGWRAACRSKKVPPWLKPGLRRAILRAEKQLAQRRRALENLRLRKAEEEAKHKKPERKDPFSRF